MGKKRLAQRGYPTVKVLCVDEIAPHKGNGSYCLVISSPGVGLLDVLKDRKKASLEAWFDARGADWCAAVEVCCADMWEAYHEAARAKLPNARQTVDRFHVMKNLNAALTTARRAIQKHADEATQAVLKGCRWLLVKNAENLSEEDQGKLQTMLAHSAELKACYELKETFRAWFNQPCTREEAERGLDVWIAKVEGSGFRALKTFVQTLTNWRERILNYFDGRYSNGYAEGVNTKVKLINREAFGYRNFENFRLHLLMAFGQ